MKVEVSELSNTGLIDISFSKVVSLPSNVTEWTQDNDGSDYLNVQYIPDILSTIMFEELGIEMNYGWSIDSIQTGERPQRRLLDSNDIGLVYVNSMTLQLFFSEPLYVSQTIEFDILKIELLEQMLKLDPSHI